MSDPRATALDLIEQRKADGWTDNQLCPECGQEPGSCDYCFNCDIELVCAQTDRGLELATKITRDDGRPYLILARPPVGESLADLLRRPLERP